ncbi:MAG: hypothetical protein V7L01_05120 [Nostoc sp.]|uniref:hypothetical protein n=1 Tax=Nostoc sp. TaxID=1180 RepID=UPI002FF5B57A
MRYCLELSKRQNYAIWDANDRSQSAYCEMVIVIAIALAVTTPTSYIIPSLNKKDS